MKRFVNYVTGMLEKHGVEVVDYSGIYRAYDPRADNAVEHQLKSAAREAYLKTKGDPQLIVCILPGR